MTVETTKITSGPYAGNGVTAQFPYDFRIDDAEELWVFETDAGDTVTLLTLGTDYTVDGVGVDQGGFVTRTAGPLPSGYLWYIRRSTPRTQPTDLNSQGGFFPDVHEAALDRLTFMVQELEDRAERALRLPDSYPGDVSVEIQGIKPLHYFRWSADGKRIEFERDVTPFDQNLNTGDAPEFEGLNVTGATKAGGTYRVQYLTGGVTKTDLVYQIAEGLIKPVVGDTVEVSAYSPTSPKCPAVWGCTAVDAELPAGAVPGDVTGVAEGRLYVTNSGGGYYRFDVAGDISVRFFGAAGDGATDDIRAIRAAVASGRQGRKGVWFPPGVYLVTDNIELDASHSGMSFVGDGPSTIIKQADDLNANNIRAGWLWTIKDDDNPITDIRISSMVLDGSRETSNWHTTSHGIRVDSTHLRERIQIDNVTAHSFITNGISVQTSDVTLSNVKGYNNGFHGIGVGSSPSPSINKSPVKIYGAVCTDNGGRGIDASAGSTVIAGAECRRNIAGGMKTSDDCLLLSMRDVLLEDNEGDGFTQTGVADDLELYADNVICRGNGGNGFRLSNGKLAKIGRLTCIGNGVAGGTPTEVLLADGCPAEVSIENLQIEGAIYHGLNVSTSTLRSLTIGYVSGAGCAGSVVRTAAGTAIDLKIKSGRMINNNLDGASGQLAACIYLAKSGNAVVHDVVFEDTQETPTQETGIFCANGLQAEVDGCTFGTGIVDGQQVYGSGAGTTVTFGRRNSGIVTRKRGAHTGDGGNTSYSVTFDPPLTTMGGAVYSVQVTPISEDASAAHWVSATSVSGLTVAYAAATPAGTENVQFRYTAELEIRR